LVEFDFLSFHPHDSGTTNCVFYQRWNEFFVMMADRLREIFADKVKKAK
jgi:hypothetical protein